MKILMDLIELAAVLITTFTVIIGGGMGFFVALGHIIR